MFPFTPPNPARRRLGVLLSLALLMLVLPASASAEPGAPVDATTVARRLPAASGPGPVHIEDARRERRLQGQRFRVLSYNVAGLPQPISSARPRKAMAEIGWRLNDYDLVLLQEDFWFHKALDRQSRHPHRSEPGHDRRLFNDGLNRFSIFPLSSVERTPWATCNGILAAKWDCLARKGFSRSTMTLPDGGQVDVYNLHADAGRGAGDQAARRTQIDQLVAAVKRRSAGRAVLVVGDTNLRVADRADARTYGALTAGAGLRDACVVLDCPGRRSIDRILYRSGPELELAPLSWNVPEGFVDEAGEPLSDHPPVAVGFRWRGVPAETPRTGDPVRDNDEDRG